MSGARLLTQLRSAPLQQAKPRVVSPARMEEATAVHVAVEHFTATSQPSAPFALPSLRKSTLETLGDSTAWRSAARTTDRDSTAASGGDKVSLLNRISLRKTREATSTVHADGELARRLRHRWDRIALEDDSTTGVSETDRNEVTADKTEERATTTAAGNKRKRGSTAQSVSSSQMDADLLHLIEVNELLEDMDQRAPFALRLHDYTLRDLPQDAASHSNPIRHYARRSGPAESNFLYQPASATRLISIGERVKNRLQVSRRIGSSSSAPSEADARLTLTIDIYSRLPVIVTRMSRQATEADSGGGKTHRRRAQDEIDGSIQHVQTIEIDSSSSLQLLADTVFCRWDDVPAEEPGPLGAVPHYTEQKVETECAMGIEEAIYTSDPQGQYASAFRLDQQQTHFVDPRPLSEVHLEDLPQLRVGQPYWHWHHGSCQHLLVITGVRLDSADIQSTNESEANVPREPVVTYLAERAVTRPGIFFRRIAKGELYRGGRCEVCQVRFPTVLLHGGERVRIHPARSSQTGTAAESQVDGLNGMQANLAVCTVCYQVATGSREPRAPPDAEVAPQQSASLAAHGPGWTTVPLLD